MATFKFGARLHDYGRMPVEQAFARIKADGYTGGQLAYKKAIEGVSSYADVTPALVQRTRKAMEELPFEVPVLGTYVELSYVDEEARKQQVADFISQIPVCKALGAGCMGSETTNMNKQPAGTTREEAQNALCRSLAEILPVAEEQGVLVAVETVFYHAMNTPEAAKQILDSMASPNLRILFDPVNVISPDLQDKQEALWDRCMNAFGDKIQAVHIKGVTFDEAGDYHSAFLEDSVCHYESVAAVLKQLPQQDLYILREEAKPDRAAGDIALFRRWFT